MRSSVVLSCALLLVFVPVVYAQHGAVTAQRNLAELTSRADLIVHAHVVSAVSEPHPKFANLQTVVVTVAVIDTLKGSSQHLYSFRQFVWDERDSRTQLGYRKGQEVLLLLNRPNENGLTSPVGLDQGRFRIVHEAGGQVMAVNGNGNQALFNGLAPAVKASGVRLSTRGQQVTNGTASGAIPLQDLETLIRSFVGAQ